ncbi:hypothetical protein KF840_21140 [bacterium]|nr:hypothetical protein [bacterium]
MAGIDVADALGQFESELEAGCAPGRRALIRAILERWRYDRDLTEDSRRRAAALLRRWLTDDPDAM